MMTVRLPQPQPHPQLLHPPQLRKYLDTEIVNQKENMPPPIIAAGVRGGYQNGGQGLYTGGPQMAAGV